MKSYPLFRFVRGIIALIIVVASFGFLYLLAYRSVPAQNRDILNLAAGSVLVVLSTVVAYYFGNSKDKSDAEQAARTDDSKPQQQNG